MEYNTYTVGLVINPDQPNITNWTFDSWIESHRFFEMLKEGVTAQTTFITFTRTRQNEDTELESWKLGDKNYPATLIKKMSYEEAEKRMGPDHDHRL